MQNKKKDILSRPITIKDVASEDVDSISVEYENSF